ncbi:molybdopterin biosynthesis protein MoeB [Planctomycetia bacterium]|nr:molybdopterin biosynthesis protein MoeB [Planctomycetia bacterium]
MTETVDLLARYSRQTRFAPLGEAGQRRLLSSRVLLVGCGALGTVLAETLTRAGVGHLRIVDRDFVETTNLQRQVLFDEDDVAAQMPKSVAAVEKLRRINSTIELEAIVADVDCRNVRELARDVDLILDGTDNFETRFLVNDLSLETGIPWVYGGCIGSHGQIMAVLPGKSACLRCVIESPPEAGTTETCETAGILGPTVNVIASWQAMLAMKILSGHLDDVPRVLTVIDLWDHTFRTLDVGNLHVSGDCPACKRGERLWLSGQSGSRSTVLCGRNSVQVVPSSPTTLSLDDLAAKWHGHGTITRNPYLTRLSLTGGEFELTVFRDGRAIVRGTQEIAAARALYARYVGG